MHELLLSVQCVQPHQSIADAMQPQFCVWVSLKPQSLNCRTGVCSCKALVQERCCVNQSRRASVEKIARKTLRQTSWGYKAKMTFHTADEAPGICKAGAPSHVRFSDTIDRCRDASNDSWLALLSSTAPLKEAKNP
jgi:hypothetical protein